MRKDSDWNVPRLSVRKNNAHKRHFKGILLSTPSTPYSPIKKQFNTLNDMQAIATQLHLKTGSEHIAFTIHKGRVHYAVAEQSGFKPIENQNSPTSPSMSLVQGLCDDGHGRLIPMAQKQEPRVVYLTYKPTILCDGMASMFNVKYVSLELKKHTICQKFISLNFKSSLHKRSEIPHSEESPESVQLGVQKYKKLPPMKWSEDYNIDRIYMMMAFRLTYRSYSLKHHDIASILVSEDGQILSWGVNTNDTKYKTRHAEVNMLQRFFKIYGVSAKNKLKNARIYTTLKPCNMCSGMIEHIASQYGMHVFYGQVDPTTLARRNMTDLSSCSNVTQAVLGRFLGGSENVPKGIRLPKGNWNAKLLGPVSVVDIIGNEQISMSSYLDKLYRTRHEKNRDLGITQHINSKEHKRIRMMAGKQLLEMWKKAGVSMTKKISCDEFIKKNIAIVLSPSGEFSGSELRALTNTYIFKHWLPLDKAMQENVKLVYLHKIFHQKNHSLPDVSS